MTRWVAAKTLDRAAAVIEGHGGIGPAELAEELGMSPASISHVVSELRKTGEVLPIDVITWRPDGPSKVRDPIQARILRRCKRGLVVVSEIAAELEEEAADEVISAVNRLRFRNAIHTPRGLWPCSAHHDPTRRAQLFADRDADDRQALPKTLPKVPAKPARKPRATAARSRGKASTKAATVPHVESCPACGHRLVRGRTRGRAHPGHDADHVLSFPWATAP